MNHIPDQRDFAPDDSHVEIGEDLGHGLNVLAEEALLGAVFENNDVLHVARTIVRPEFFTTPIRQAIFDAALNMADAGETVTPVTMRPYLAGFGDVDGMSPFLYSVALRSESAGVQAARGYASAVRSAWARRQMQEIGEDLVRRSREDSPQIEPEDIAAVTADGLADVIHMCSSTKRSRQYGDVLLAAVRAAEDRQRSPDAGIDWFLPELNEVVGPVRPGNLIGFMSDSGGGKTSLSLSQCRFVADKGVPSAFFSIEVTADEAAMQMASQRLRVSMSEMDRMDLLRGKADELMLEMEKANSLPLVIEPFSDADLKTIGAMIASLKKRMGLRFVMIDHAKMITLPGAKGDMFAEKVNGLYRGLKSIAKSTGVAIVILIQRNSDWKARENPRPIPSDAYGGGAVMQNLDAFFSIYRPEPLYANKLETEVSEKKREHLIKVMADTRGYAWVMNHKRRRGEPQGSRRVKFEAEFTLFASETTSSLPPELF